MTIEELADSMCQKIWLDVSEPMCPLKDRYRAMKERIVYGLNAAHAEGVVEGAEETKAMILRESMPVVADFLHIPSVIVHVSALAPTKEKVMTPEETAAQHKMVEKFTKSIDDIMIQAINFRPDKEEHKETATERQERILKDKRDYSFSRFMFGRMNKKKP